MICFEIFYLFIYFFLYTSLHDAELLKIFNWRRALLAFIYIRKIACPFALIFYTLSIPRSIFFWIGARIICKVIAKFELCFKLVAFEVFIFSIYRNGFRHHGSNSIKK